MCPSKRRQKRRSASGNHDKLPLRSFVQLLPVQLDGRTDGRTDGRDRRNGSLWGARNANVETGSTALLPSFRRRSGKISRVVRTRRKDKTLSARTPKGSVIVGQTQKVNYIPTIPTALDAFSRSIPLLSGSDPGIPEKPVSPSIDRDRHSGSLKMGRFLESKKITFIVSIRFLLPFPSSH